MTAAGIVTLAFGEFVKAGAGEIAKKAIGSIEPLRAAIKQRFAGNQKAKTSIERIEQEGSTDALNKLSVYLDDEMADAAFAQTLYQLANQVITFQKTENRQFNSNGRDQIKIDTINGNPRIGGS